MRYVKRSDVPIPSVFSLIEKLSKEKQKAKAHFEKMIQDAAKPAAPGSKPAKRKSFDGFKLYKDVSIKEALEKLFLGKCAYCESRYAGIHPVDIEHWRPKAEVTIDDQGNARYGYYWLAASWENLLPSCIDCNRTRKHKDFVENREVKIGKGNWFPLANDAHRAGAEGEESNEEPLLINPCQDKPEEYLEFHAEGFVKAKLDNGNQPSAKAKASIQCYALNRTELVLDRRERVLIIQQKMHIIRKLAECLNVVKANSELSVLIEDLLSHELKRLDEFEHPSQPFSMMAKQMIDDFKKTFQR